MTGKNLGNYEIVGKIGEGGMGEVWRARDRRLQRTVAVKMLPAAVAADPGRRARFEQEARALGALNHPNVVAVYDVGEDEGRAYMVSELVEGESLRALIDRGAIPPRRAVDIAVQMADGIAAAHALGIIHRDLKPENVMVTRDGQVKLLDFGLAKQNASGAGENTATIAMGISEPGILMGTVGYMSPEQVRGESAGARSDIFSFGCVLYEMLTGKRAFEAGTGVETMHAILNADPPEFQGDQAGLPPALTAVVMRCLEKRPDRRFQSAADLAFALRAIATTRSTPAQHAIAEPRAAPRSWIWPVAAIAAALTLFGLGFAARSLTQRIQSPTYQRITFRKGFVITARFAPHTREVVYQASWEGATPHTYLAVPGTPESRDLNMPKDVLLLAISAHDDMALIAPPFDEYASGTLMDASFSGGRTRPLLRGVLAADWAPDGACMAVLRRASGENRLEYPIGTVLASKIGWPLWMIRVSPDGERVAYVTRTNGHAVGLWVVDRARNRTLLGPVSGQNTTGEIASLCWNAAGTEIWFRSFDPREPGVIYAVNLKGKRRVALRLPTVVKLYDISSKGDVLLSTGSTQLGILGQAPNATTEHDLSCLDSGKVAGISDDGQVVVANITGESGGAKGSVYMRKTDGSQPIRISDGYAYRLSPDGEWTSGYTLNPDGSRRFVLQPTGPGEATEAKAPGLEATVVYGWLDGQRYLVGGHLPNKRWQCFVWDAGRHTLQPLCAEGSPDSLAYFVSPDRKLVLMWAGAGNWDVYPLNGGPPQAAHGIARDETVVGWRNDNRSVYVRPDVENTDSIPVAIVDLVTGKRSAWKTIHPAQPVIEIHDLHVTPDGRAYAYNYATTQSDLYVARGLD
ncbi:MAG TPA: serine/threonine-protein kinase [Bryobacteraceae bacterium]|nr:serine/threonine-protein kinase [Bryobacteraceae bacterium]